MKRKTPRKHKIISRLSLLILLCTCILAFSSCAQTKQSSLPISPAINCIAEQNSMAKSVLKGNSITFSPDDFARATNLSNIDKITITAVPPTTDGELRVGSTVLTSEQTLSAASVSLMTYAPSTAVSSSEFRFRVNDIPYEMCCKLYVLDEQNYAPTLSSAPKTALEVSTYKNVTYFGTLPCYDPDGDKTYIEIVSYPEKGVLVLDDREVGSYRFIPYEDSVGKDSFTYVARDIYGNYSPSATVSLSINKKETPVSYVDLDNSPYHNAALTMTQKGIMSGTQIGNNTYFYPDKTVSRAEFTVMAMNAAGIKDINPTAKTVFADDDQIPSQMRDYIGAAYELGYIRGIETDGKLCFEPNREITRAEAAVILANILDAATPTIKPTFKDSEDIPTWAEPSINALNVMGVMSTVEDNSISPLTSLTRGEAASILCSFMLVK